MQSRWSWRGGGLLRVASEAAGGYESGSKLARTPLAGAWGEQCGLICGSHRPTARVFRQRRNMLRACGRLERGTLLGDQVISDLEGLLRATGRAQVEAILALSTRANGAVTL